MHCLSGEILRWRDESEEEEEKAAHFVFITSRRGCGSRHGVEHS